VKQSGHSVICRGIARLNPVAEILSTRKVPFLFVTGYSAEAMPQDAGQPRIGKPFRSEQLIGALTELVGSSPSR
jgi:hypothetical protein